MSVNDSKADLVKKNNKLIKYNVQDTKSKNSSKNVETKSKISSMVSRESGCMNNFGSIFKEFFCGEKLNNKKKHPLEYDNDSLLKK